MSRLVLVGLGICILASIPACRIPGGVVDTWTEEGRPLPPTDWASKSAFFRSFRSSEISATSTAIATGPGGTATAYGRTITTSDSVSSSTCNLAARKLPFDLVSPMLTNATPDFILEGHLKGPNGWEGKWWTWAQAFLLWLPSYVLPSNGTSYTFDFEMNLFDADHRLLHTWRCVRVKHYHEYIWAMLLAVERSKEYEQEFLEEAMTRVGAEMKKLAAPPAAAPST